MGTIPLKKIGHMIQICNLAAVKISIFGVTRRNLNNNSNKKKRFKVYAVSWHLKSLNKELLDMVSDISGKWNSNIVV